MKVYLGFNHLYPQVFIRINKFLSKMLSLLNGDEYPESAISTPSADTHSQVLLPLRTAEQSPCP